LAATTRVLPDEVKTLFRERVEALPSGLPLSRDAFLHALENAWRGCGLDARTVVSRFLWLVDPHRPGTEGIRVFEHFPSFTQEQLAHAIVDPRETVIEIIAAKSGVARPTLLEIHEAIASRGNPGEYGQIADLAEERILQEMKWWLTDLRFPEYYLRNTPPELMARQIMLNRSYELGGFESEAYTRMKVSSTSPDGTSMHWVHKDRSIEVEEEIEKEYYAGASLFNVAVYAPYQNLRLYVVYRSPAAPSGDGFEVAAPLSFRSMTESAAQRRYEKVWKEVLATGSIAIDLSRKDETGENRIMIGFPRRTINHFQANISRVMARNGIEVTRKYTVTIGGSRPVIIASLYARESFPPDLLRQLVEVSLYPPGPAAGLVEKGALSPVEANFLNAAVLFVHQFISVPDLDIKLLSERFRGDREMGGILRSIQARIDKDIFAQGSIEQVFIDRPDIVHALYALFAARFDPAGAREAAVQEAARGHIDELLASSALGVDEAEIARWALRFIESVERTNFYLPIKTALSFRLASAFFKRPDIESVPFGVFFIVGRSFHGFHVRFQDIARGGIRIVRSANTDDWLRNSDTLFEECFNLAFTQNKKNKDIPEGGSKGVILPALGARGEEAVVAFQKYVDALLDLLVPPDRSAIVGWTEEILFLGPDEGTADLMDWACRRARERGYRYWKAFTTGKEAALGGISHKEFGMTTEGVHRYVLGILGKLGIAEESITKAQTGGPDGDLGSNEILISRDRTIALVDGGGVVYDPAGLDRKELARLARQGSDSSGFDPKRLGPKGFKVGLVDKAKSLPDGTIVASGLGFRNTFHLDRRMKADLFLPCGGRPKSVNLNNWRSLLDEDGNPVFRWIVEGANLFITQEARLKLEEKGVILFKDSSTNKGGVISSSLEVLAGLALTDEEYGRLMTVSEGGQVPAFRKRYIEEVLTGIRAKADREFELMWTTHAAKGTPYSELSEAVSERINTITRSIQESALFENEKARRSAFRLHVPAALIETIGMDAIVARLPGSYQRALFASTIASSFIYRYGIEAGFEDYRRYTEELAKGE
jgi:glutamate dehydrogenase